VISPSRGGLLTWAFEIRLEKIGGVSNGGGSSKKNVSEKGEVLLEYDTTDSLRGKGRGGGHVSAPTLGENSRWGRGMNYRRRERRGLVISPNPLEREW